MTPPPAPADDPDAAHGSSEAPVDSDGRLEEPDLPGVIHPPVTPPRDAVRTDAPWWRRRPGTATVVGVLAGVALYLVVVVGEPGLALGLLLVAALALSLGRSVRSLRAARRREEEGP